MAATQQQYGLAAAPQPATAFDQLGLLLQALRQRQIPPLPGLSPQYAPALTPTAPTAPQADGIGLLRLILGNPQFQQALHSSAVLGSAAPRNVELPLPVAGPVPRMRTTPIPLGAVMNAIYALAGQSMAELNESTREDDPEVPPYLVDEEGEFIVDPASSGDRAALAVHLFRLSDEAQRSGRFQQRNARLPEADGELDECDEWARDAGFTR